MAIARRGAPAAVASGGSVNFGDDSFYLGGLGLPEGDYAVEWHTQMFQPTKRDGSPTGAPFLAVMGAFYPLSGGEPSEHPFGCGAKSHESFVPSADGKGFDSVPGGPGIGINESCNWALMRKSMIDCGLPVGVMTNSLSPLDGIWVHTTNIPEPEERKNFRGTGRTGAAALQQADPNANRNRVCVVVSAILDGGKPWEGTGGIPEAGKTAPKVVARPTVVRRGVVPVAPVAAVEEVVTEEDLKTAAINGIAEHLGKTPNGCTKIALRTGTFAAVSASAGEDMGNAVLETYFGSDDALNIILGEVGYGVVGISVKPVK